MKIPAGQRIFTRSSITGERLECFIPTRIGKLSIESLCAENLIDAPSHSQRGSIRPFAAIVVSRGRLMLSAEVLDQTDHFIKLVNRWTNKPLSTTTICDLHAQLMGNNNGPSQFRDSMVWVDGLTPKDAKLIPGPASGVLPALHDYFEFTACRDIWDWIKLAIAHFQILAIHPFFDGNGRLSRAIALIHAQRFLGAAQSYALAAALSLHRRAMRPLLQEVRCGDLTKYIGYWQKLISWSADCVAQAERLREGAQEEIRIDIAKLQLTERLVAFLLDQPIFSAGEMIGRLSLSPKLVSLHILTLQRAGIIEVHRQANQTLLYRCPTGIRFWQQASETTASTSTKLLAPENANEATSRRL